MFTGIIQGLGRVEALEQRGGDVRLRIGSPAALLQRLATGDSVAVSGVCLTVAELSGTAFAADVSRETLDCTTLGTLAAGTAVNLEPALRLGDALGGHIVSGHVDGVAEVLALHPDARSTRILVAAPVALRRYVVPKGSVTLAGVSLTVNEVEADRFGVNLIPHTLAHTTLGTLAPGGLLNLEIDALARYIEGLLQARSG